jgi:hypothetical protein
MLDFGKGIDPMDNSCNASFKNGKFSGDMSIPVFRVTVGG